MMSASGAWPPAPPSTATSVSTSPVAPSAAWTSDSAHGPTWTRNTDAARTRPAPAAQTQAKTALKSIPSYTLGIRRMDGGGEVWVPAVTVAVTHTQWTVAGEW